MRGAMPTVPVVPGWRRSSTASTVLSNRPDSNAKASEVELPTIDAQGDPAAAGLALLRRAHAEASREPEELTRLHQSERPNFYSRPLRLARPSPPRLLDSTGGPRPLE